MGPMGPMGPKGPKGPHGAHVFGPGARARVRFPRQFWARARARGPPGQPEGLLNLTEALLHTRLERRRHGKSWRNERTADGETNREKPA